MSDSTPTPVTPPTAPPVKVVDWAKLITLVLVLLAQLGVLFKNEPPPEPPVVVVEPSAPLTQPKPPAKTEAAYVFDETDKRVSNPAIEQTALTLKSGRWKVLLIPEGGGDLRNLTITVDDGSLPPVVPPPPVVVPPPIVVPPPVVEPPLPPSPFPAEGFRVLILEESGERTPALQSLIHNPEVEGYLNTKCAKGIDAKATPEWRVLDDDYTTEQQKRWADSWQKAYEAAKKDSAGKRPWIVVGNGKSGESVPLPTSRADLLTLLRKYGG